MHQTNHRNRLVDALFLLSSKIIKTILFIRETTSVSRKRYLSTLKNRLFFSI
ncbi:hypothetical protein HMPREF0973_01167 [Prevotella veroralis F0319]|uniref:Uncharacterized protein n=1 Tax=Prevotella veroralis F0319 TaxID=649761 RepID=C9MNI0_9BACT|nr:hypothetical protein HMPREF0973_01167 [Prevotella veroralis F0319]